MKKHTSDTLDLLQYSKYTEISVFTILQACKVTSQYILYDFLFKGHRKRISTVGYKTTFIKINSEETFCHLQSLEIRTIFQEKKAKFAKFTVVVYVIYIYGRDNTILKLVPTANCNIVCKYC